MQLWLTEMTEVYSDLSLTQSLSDWVWSYWVWGLTHTSHASESETECKLSALTQSTDSEYENNTESESGGVKWIGLKSEVGLWEIKISASNMN